MGESELNPLIEQDGLVMLHEKFFSSFLLLGVLFSAPFEEWIVNVQPLAGHHVLLAIRFVFLLDLLGSQTVLDN
jgi:hypothetical protein